MIRASDIEAADSRAITLQSKEAGPLYSPVEALLVVVPVFAIESYLVAQYAASAWPTWLVLGSHVVVLSAIGAWCYGLFRRDGGLHMAALLGVSVSVLGPFGAVGTLLTIALHWWFSRTSTSFQDWYMSLFPDEEGDEARELYELIVTGREGVTENSTVRSFTEVMTHGNTTQKQAVIALLSRNFRPGFAPALKLALSDEDASLRVQAATAAANIENHFLEKSLEFQAKFDENPNDFDTVLAMARHYDDYAFSGILDDDQENENRRLAIEYYFRCLDIRPDEPQATTAVGRFLLREGKLGDASTWIATAIEEGIDHLTMLNWHLECLYQMGHYDRIRKFVSERYDELAMSARQPQVLRDVVNVWAGYRPGQKTPDEEKIETDRELIPGLTRALGEAAP